MSQPLVSEVKSATEFINAIRDEELKKTLSIALKEFNHKQQIKRFLKGIMKRFDMSKIQKYRIDRPTNTCNTWLIIYFKNEWSQISATIDEKKCNPFTIRICDDGYTFINGEWNHICNVKDFKTFKETVDKIVSYIKPEFLAMVQRMY